ncbi:MAG: PQQ-binding-like beta-propeller repeat protein [candidate division WOR-3 bacterium]
MTITALLLTLTIGVIAPPDSLAAPMRADTVTEMELLIFPPAGATLPLWYRVDWGDGETLDWSGPLQSPVDISRFHRYRKFGGYEIRVMAKDSLGRVSDWSRPVAVEVGEPIFKGMFPTEEPIVASPTLDQNGNIYFGDESGTFYSVNPDGNLRWSFMTRGPVYGTVAITGALVYFVSLDSSLYCLDTTGRLQWSLDLGDELYVGPAIGKDGTVYVGTDKGQLVAVSPKGKILWQRPVHGEVTSPPTIGPNGLIYQTADSLYCFDRKGRRRWAFAAPVGSEEEQDRPYFWGSPVIGEKGVVLVGGSDGYLYAVGSDGRMRWRSPVPDQDEIRPEVVFGPDGTGYFGSDGYYLLAWSGTGTVRVLYEADDIVSATPAVSDKGTVYFLADDGVLYARAANGRLLWKQEVAYGDKALYWTSSPTIAPDGTVYVGSWDGGLYAFRGDGPPAKSRWPQFRHDAQHTGRCE